MTHGISLIEFINRKTNQGMADHHLTFMEWVFHPDIFKRFRREVRAMNGYGGPMPPETEEPPLMLPIILNTYFGSVTVTEDKRVSPFQALIYHDKGVMVLDISDFFEVTYYASEISKETNETT